MSHHIDFYEDERRLRVAQGSAPGERQYRWQRDKAEASVLYNNRALKNLDGVKAAIVALAAHIWAKASPQGSHNLRATPFPV